MARTAITVTSLTAETVNAVVLASMGVAIDATNSHVITPGAGVDPRDCFIFIYHTTGSSKTATLNAGDNPPAMRQGGGNLVATMTDGSTTPTLAIIPLSSSRFMQSDGTFEVDIAASMTGRIACFRMPRTA